MINERFARLYLFILIVCLAACKQEDTLFIERSDVIQFNNNLTYTEDFNPYLYRNFYNGGGVSLGDINNDGLLDVYLTGNMVDNKMFLNKGNWEFEDITERSGLACSNVWSTGANFVDINADGLLDIYVCKGGKPEGPHRFNELFINQGNLQFEEQSAQYGLNIKGLSIQSAFFDYDRDGDLDCYLLNNSIKAVGGFELIKNKRNTPSEQGNKLLENRDNYFYDVTEESGIYSSEIGFGLGITLSDFNLDGWPDIYISNDFFEKDYFYINNQDGTFQESGESYFTSFPLGSMGADAADLNNDLQPDLMITEMLPSSLERKKTKAAYESWKKFNLAESNGYARQYPRNMLQFNAGQSGFVELGRMAGVSATDWSWSSLLQDFDNDGLKDIFVSNGIFKDLLDRDYLAFIANDQKVKSIIQKGGNAIMSLVDSMPSAPISNFCFKNVGDYQFVDVSKEWGLGQKSFSNGCAYGDLDNDGDLDLVVNNVNMSSFVFENTSHQNGNNYVKIDLIGTSKNTKAIGSKVIAYACGKSFMSEQFPSRGFQSSIPNQILMGIGQCSMIDSVRVIWPDGKIQVIEQIQINKKHTIAYPETLVVHSDLFKIKNDFVKVSIDTLDIKHEDIKFNQFNRERLLYKMNSAEGPAMAVADCNGDGKDDIFIGGAKNQTSKLLLTNHDTLVSVTKPFSGSIRSEVVEAKFFDLDNDGDLDLYVAHGGSAFSPYAQELNDEIYLNNGKGHFQLLSNAIQFPSPIATGAIAIDDFNQDGFVDLFIGERNSNKDYGVAGHGYLYRNTGNLSFELINTPALKDLGMITDASWIDVNQDSKLELLIVGEWLAISLFMEEGGEYIDVSSKYGLENTVGIWNDLLVLDFDQDGDQDILVGNIGLNTFITPKHRLYVHDFDGNGSVEQILCEEIAGSDFPSIDMDELVSQLPSLKKKNLFYNDYAQASMKDLFGVEILKEAKVIKLQSLETQLLLLKDGKFVKQTLPIEIQFSSVHNSLAQDFDQDGDMDIVMGGNHYLVKPQFGQEDASKGWLLINNDESTVPNFSIQSLNVSGQIRDFDWLEKNTLVVGINNQKVLTYTFTK